MQFESNTGENSPQDTYFRTLNRRSLLIKAGSLAVSVLVGCNSKESTNLAPTVYPQTSATEEYFIGFSEKRVKIRAARPRYVNKKTDTEIDSHYLEELVHILRNTDAHRNDRAKSVISNLAWVVQDGTCTALKIDASGYYITAAHQLLDSNGQPVIKYGLIYEPLSGISTPIQNIVLPENPLDDIGLIYAPSGEPRRPTTGIAFDFSPLQDGDKLWMHALNIELPNASRFILHGTVDSSLPNQRAYVDGNIVEITQMPKIIGMIPFAGSSGSPIIDSNGKIRGIESGAITNNGTNKLESYIGATVAPIEILDKLVESAKLGKVVRLPITCEYPNVSNQIKC